MDCLEKSYKRNTQAKLLKSIKTPLVKNSSFGKGEPGIFL